MLELTNLSLFSKLMFGEEFTWALENLLGSILLWRQGFSQMGVQASCGRPLYKQYCFFFFHMLLHKLFIWEQALYCKLDAHFSCSEGIDNKFYFENKLQYMKLNDQ